MGVGRSTVNGSVLYIFGPALVVSIVVVSTVVVGAEVSDGFSVLARLDVVPFAVSPQAEKDRMKRKTVTKQRKVKYFPCVLMARSFREKDDCCYIRR